MGIEVEGTLMAKLAKRIQKFEGLVDRNKTYAVTDALELVKKTATAKFDESVDVAINLGIDAKKSDQSVRGSVVLPRGTGKSVRGRYSRRAPTPTRPRLRAQM